MADTPATEILLPTPRQVAVARAYVEGLERDRAALEVMTERTQKTIWEVIQLGSYNRAMYQVLAEIVREFDKGRAPGPTTVTRIENLLEANRPLYESVWSCDCGHSKYDHDETGCLYLGCKSICGKVD